MIAACVLDMIDETEQKKLRGRLLGSINIRRTRKRVEKLWQELGCYARTRSGNLGGRRSVLGGARMYAAQLQ